MKSTNTFKNAIKAYLDKRAETDELFAASYAKEGKNIDDCCTYILNQVQQSGCAGFEDSEIFGMAVHYYDEDNIKVGDKISCKVVVNHTVELTEEEKEQAKKNALDAYQKEQLEALKKRVAKPAKKKEEKVVQQSLFD